jgi:hypothetical protein
METDRFTKYFWTIMHQSVFRILFMRHHSVVHRSLKVTLKHFIQTQFNKWRCRQQRISIPKETSSGNLQKRKNKPHRRVTKQLKD